MGRLSQAERTRVRVARGRLEAAYAGAGYHLEVARALDGLDTDGVGLMYDWSPERGIRYTVEDPVLLARLNKPSLARRVVRHRRYDPYQPDARDRLALTADHLFGDDRRSLEAMIENLLRPEGFRDQLRSVHYHHGRFLAWVGLLSPRAGRYTDRHEELLSPLLEIIHEGLVLTRLVRGTRRAAELCRILDAVPSPIFVAHPSGRAVFANRTARRTASRPAEWLRAAIADPAAAQATVSKIRIDREEYRLIALPCAPLLPVPSTVPESWKLPRRLGEVATLLVQGLSDKEVAERLSMPLPTERTYVARLYRRLGVHSRLELLRLAARDD